MQIYSLMNGANDVEIIPPDMGRVPENLDWRFDKLNIFSSSNKIDRNQTFHFAKGYAEGVFSRFVESIIKCSQKKFIF